jgi:hypothetical protein
MQIGRTIGDVVVSHESAARITARHGGDPRHALRHWLLHGMLSLAGISGEEGAYAERDIMRALGWQLLDASSSPRGQAGRLEQGNRDNREDRVETAGASVAIGGSSSPMGSTDADNVPGGGPLAGAGVIGGGWYRASGVDSNGKPGTMALSALMADAGMGKRPGAGGGGQGWVNAGLEARLIALERKERPVSLTSHDCVCG